MDSLLYLLFYFALQNFQQDRLKRLTTAETPTITVENTSTQIVHTGNTPLHTPIVEPYVIHWSNEVQDDEEIQNANQLLTLYLNQITFPEENWKIATFFNKHTHIQEKRIYDINALITYKNNQDPSFYEKFSKTIYIIALPQEQSYDLCYKYLFQLLLKYFKENEIKTFQNLFESCQPERKDLIFSYWFVITFPDTSIESFLQYSIKYMKGKIYNKSSLKNLDLYTIPTVQRTKDIKKLIYAFEFLFPNNAYLNPNASLILVKILQFLDKEDTENKDEIMSLISHSCFSCPLNYAPSKIFTWERNCPFYEEVKWDGHKLIFIYYKLPDTDTIVAITEASYLKELNFTNPPKIYYGQYNFACIVLPQQMSSNIQPLTEKEIEQLSKINGALILINPNTFQTISGYYYTPQQNGVAFIMSEDSKKCIGLKKLLEINQELLKSIR